MGNRLSSQSGRMERGEIQEVSNAEEWRPVVGHEGLYEVSNEGRVRSLNRVIWQYSRHGVLHPHHLRGRVLRGVPTPAGYRKVQLGARNDRLVHSLVLEAFVGPRPVGQVSCHYNDHKDDNRLANLRYDTEVANVADAKRNGTFRTGPHPRGTAHPLAKLTDRQVARVRRESVSSYALAREFGVTPTTIQKIRRGQSWKLEGREQAA